MSMLLLLSDDGPSPPPPVYTCGYAFDSTNAQAQSFGYTGAASMSDQTATYVLRGQLANDETFVSTNSAFQTVDFSTGKKTIEVAFNSSSALSKGTAAIISVSVINPANFSSVAALGFFISSGLLLMVVNASGVSSYTSATTQSTTAGITLNALTGTISVNVNGEVVTLSSDTFTPGDYILTIQTAEAPGGHLMDAGLTLTAEVRTSASDMTQTYETGATDICGNPV